MKLPVRLALSAAILTGVCVAASAADLKTDTDKLSYTIGVDLGKSFKRQNIQITPAALSQGVADSYNGATLQMTPEQMRQTMVEFQQKIMKERQQMMQAAADKNKTAGEAFLAKNKSEKDVVTTASGLQYKVLTAGKGAKPTASDIVTVEYTGRLINGTVFDSTEKSGKPVSFRLNEVIPGWTEALQLMQEGATWEIYVPSKLAYGERGVGGPIGPNETLIFKIHLISIKKQNA